MSDVLQLVLGKLDAVRQQGGSWMARCPAHEDTKASLSVEAGDTQPAVLKCMAGCATADVLTALGLTFADISATREEQAASACTTYDYVDENGELLFQVVRKPGKKFSQRRPDGRGGWEYKLSGTRRVVYRLPKVVEAVMKGETVYIAEGEKDVHALEYAGAVATCNPGGAGKWKKEFGAHFADADVVIVADKDEPGRQHARFVAASLRGVASAVRIVEALAGKDAADHFQARHGLDDFTVMSEPAAPGPQGAQGDQADRDGQGHGRGPSQASVLVEIAAEKYRLLVGDDGQPYAVSKDGPNIALPFRGSSGLRTQLAKVYADQGGGAVPSSSALTDALTVLTGRAETAEPETVALRVARTDDGIVLDLGTPDGRCVVIGPGGWRAESRSPVLFRRTRLTAPLPDPFRRGTLAGLRALLNVDDDGWHLIIGWLLAALMPDVPSPILALFGLQGTAKSAGTRMLIRMIDPSPAPTRTAPKDIRTWAVTANAATLIGLDNVSSIADWLSDALCRAVTGEGLIDRALYTDADVSVIAFRRVIVLNGIDVGSLAGDLAERLIPLELEPITHRRTESELWSAYDDAHPQALGALLDLLAKVLEVIADIQVDELPRMADFARVLAALDQVTSWDSLQAYKEATDSAQEIVVESSAFAAAVRNFALHLAAGEDWKGTASQLLDKVTPVDAAGKPRSPERWPKNPRSASGRLKRDLPALASGGINVSFGKDGGERFIRISADETRSQDGSRRTASVASSASSTTTDQLEHHDANSGVPPVFASTPLRPDANEPGANAFASRPDLAPEQQERPCPDAKDAKDGTSQLLSVVPASDSDNEYPEDWPAEMPENWGEWPA